MNYYDPNSYRSPETKSEVKQAAKILFGLGVLSGLSALFGFIMRFVSRDTEWFIFAFILGGIAPLLFAAGAYNIYYTRRMQHHPFAETALRNPAITVVVILLIICAVVFGAVGLLIYFK